MVTVEGTEVDLDVMIIHIEGLQGAHHIEVAGIIRQGARPMAEDLGGKGPGHSLILHMVAQTGGMLVDLGDAFGYRSLKRESKNPCNYYGTLTMCFCLYVMYLCTGRSLQLCMRL